MNPGGVGCDNVISKTAHLESHQMKSHELRGRAEALILKVVCLSAKLNRFESVEARTGFTLM